MFVRSKPWQLVLTAIFFCSLASTVNAHIFDDPSLLNPYQEKLDALKKSLASDDSLTKQDDDWEEYQALDNKRFRGGALQRNDNQLDNIRLPPTQIASISAKQKHPRGLSDPHFPTTITIKPRYIPLPPLAPDAIRALGCDAGLLDLTALTAALSTQLSRQELKILLAQLAKIPVKVKWKDKHGHTRSGPRHFFETIRTSPWEKTNAAAAVALLAGSQHNNILLTDIIALAPDAVMFLLDGDAAAVIDVKVAAAALIAIMAQLDTTNTKQIASSTANIVQVFVEYRADGDADQQLLALTTLIFESYKTMKNSALIFSRKQLGILLGGLLAGSLLYAKKIKSTDERNLWLINSISNLVWASSAFLGVIPLAGGAVAALAGALSVGVVTWAVVYNKIGTRDFTPRIKEVEGHIELAALELAQGKSHKTKIHMLEVLSWMHGALHVNGLND